MAELVEIGYERLFNLGNFEHEKFLIKKSVQADTEFMAWKKLATDLGNFERDLVRFRKSLEEYYYTQNKLSKPHYISDKDKEEAIKKLKGISKVVHDFETLHSPLAKPCKCAFCQAKDKEITDGT